MRLGKLIQYEIKNQTAVLEFENGEARIEVCGIKCNLEY